MIVKFSFTCEVPEQLDPEALDIRSLTELIEDRLIRPVVDCPTVEVKS